jgi:hypothetical protein
MPIYFNDKTWSEILKHKDTELDPPATAKKLAAFEARNRFALPEAHREFLLRANGDPGTTSTCPRGRLSVGARPLDCADDNGDRSLEGGLS